MHEIIVKLNSGSDARAKTDIRMTVRIPIPNQNSTGMKNVDAGLSMENTPE
jgi:hypothetical protein